MTTEYEIRLDRGACDGIFACLVRDDRFAEADDGLATVEGAAVGDGGDRTETETIVASFDDDEIDAARQAASACPVDAIAVTEGGDD